MPFTLLQTVNPAVSTTAITASMTLTRPGNLLLVFIGSSGTTDVVNSVTDNAGNNYTKAYSTNVSDDTELWYAFNARQTTSIVTAFSGSTTTKSVFVREYGGNSRASSLKDRTTTGNGTGTAVATGTTSAVRDADLVICSCSYRIASASLSAGGSFGNFSQQTFVSGGVAHAIEDLTTTVGATPNGTMTGSSASGLWDVGIACFLPAPGSAVAVRQLQVGGGMSRGDINN